MTTILLLFGLAVLVLGPKRAVKLAQEGREMVKTLQGHRDVLLRELHADIEKDANKPAA